MFRFFSTVYVWQHSTSLLPNAQLTNHSQVPLHHANPTATLGMSKFQLTISLFNTDVQRDIIGIASLSPELFSKKR